MDYTTALVPLTRHGSPPTRLTTCHRIKGTDRGNIVLVKISALTLSLRNPTPTDSGRKSTSSRGWHPFLPPPTSDYPVNGIANSPVQFDPGEFSVLPLAGLIT